MKFKLNTRYKKYNFLPNVIIVIVLLVPFIAALFMSNPWINMLVYFAMIALCLANIETLKELNDYYGKKYHDVQLTNYEREYCSLARATAWCYGIAGFSILLLPFLKNIHGSAVWGFDCFPPVPYLFSAFSLIAFWDYYAHLKQNKGTWVTFNLGLPIALTIVSVLFFLIGGRYVNAFMEGGMFSDFPIVSGLHFLGPLVYCICLSIASFFTIMLNKTVTMIKTQKE
ncbi:MAG: hypothetical protein J6X01_03265 [Bacteroidales bacterium]|nr:hypothetical protein [Bacteroidales bacterium]